MCRTFEDILVLRGKRQANGKEDSAVGKYTAAKIHPSHENCTLLKTETVPTWKVEGEGEGSESLKEKAQDIWLFP